jgi:hypothetical protein
VSETPAATQKLDVTCAECGAKSQIKIPINVALDRCAAAMQQAMCPECGGKKLLL